jgi:hypothetical protein
VSGRRGSFRKAQGFLRRARPHLPLDESDFMYSVALGEERDENNGQAFTCTMRNDTPSPSHGRFVDRALCEGSGNWMGVEHYLGKCE